MADQLEVNLLKSILRFSSRIQTQLVREMETIDEARGLCERDLMLLEWLSTQDQTSFSQAVEYGTLLDCRDDGKSKQVITAAIGKMSKKLGLIKATRNKDDERRKTLSITTKGKDLVVRWVEVRTAFFKKSSGLLAKQIDKGTMRQLVSCLISAEV